MTIIPSIRPLLALANDVRLGKPAVMRSPKWHAVERAHLKLHPWCEVCKTRSGVEVHHVIPFHVDAAHELDPTNLISLCRVHHLLFGHLGDWKSWNLKCADDVRVWDSKFLTRPYLAKAA